MLTREVMYDIETLPNMFLCTIYDPFIGRVTTYHAGYECNYTRSNEFVETVYDLEKYIHWLKRKNYLMVGFNNYHYDNPVIHHLLNNLSYFDGSKEEELCKDIFNFSTRIIEDAAQGNRFAHTIWDRDMIVPQLDLFKVHHFDNKAKTVSLKRLEFNMRRGTVLEYTEGFDHQVSTEEEVKKLIEYNIEDVLATYQFRQMSAEQVDFRKSLVDTWGIEVLNYNDTKIGEKLIERRLKEEVGLNALYTYEEGEYGETIRTMKQTPRSYVDLRDIIFPNVRFEARKLRDLLKFMKKLRVYVDGMRFEWSELSDYQNGKFLISQKEQEGLSANEIVANIERIRPKVRSSFVIDTLTYLARGGRCSSVVALTGGVLKIHPKIVVKDGKMEVSKKYRGQIRNVVMDYVKDMHYMLLEANPTRVFITHTSKDRELIEEVRSYLEGLGHFEEILETSAGAVISSHCGPGTLGVLFIEG